MAPPPGTISTGDQQDATVAALRAREDQHSLQHDRAPAVGTATSAQDIISSTSNPLRVLREELVLAQALLEDSDSGESCNGGRPPERKPSREVAKLLQTLEGEGLATTAASSSVSSRNHTAASTQGGRKARLSTRTSASSPPEAARGVSIPGSENRFSKVYVAEKIVDEQDATTPSPNTRTRSAHSGTTPVTITSSSLEGGFSKSTTPPGLTTTASTSGLPATTERKKKRSLRLSAHDDIIGVQLFTDDAAPPRPRASVPAPERVVASRIARHTQTGTNEHFQYFGGSSSKENRTSSGGPASPRGASAHLFDHISRATSAVCSGGLGSLVLGSPPQGNRSVSRSNSGSATPFVPSPRTTTTSSSSSIFHVIGPTGLLTPVETTGGSGSRPSGIGSGSANTTASGDPPQRGVDPFPFLTEFLAKMTGVNGEDAALASQSLELVIRKIRVILQDSTSIRQALYFRLLRITQYLAWKFPAYGALQHLLEDVLRSKAIIGKQTTTVHLLGKRYPAVTDKAFEEEWNSKFLFTYRKGFRSIGNANITSDQGWGCYIRTFQMMLAQCYALIVFGPGRRDARDEPQEREFVKELFVDNEKAFFSVHNFCRIGATCFNRKPGTWFGPFSAAKTIEKIFDEIGGTSSSSSAPGGGATGSTLTASSTGGPTTTGSFAHHARVCVFDELLDPDEVRAKLVGNKNVIILLCKKLGPHQSVSPEYTEAIKQVFKLPSFQGLACGDTATSAHYFIAASDTYCYYLDPHVETRAALDGAEMDISSWHALKNSDGRPCLFKLAFENLNSSCCFCFLIRDEEELAQLCLEMEMYDALHEAFEIKRCGFLESLTGNLDLRTDQKWAEDDGMVLL
ncbi:unnamed protein product [Amoebophrya sp. A25]|nr:unnamed protein product [Amoebophrya sp. A25]|eukprot:GSA25T00015395001.1